MKKKIFRIHNNLGSISKSIISSFALILLFYATPIIINFADQNILKEEYKNDSKKILAYTLNNKPQNNNETINEKDLLVDILNLNEPEVDSVRLSASTIKQLFEDTNYNLNDVRKNKIVKPVALSLLPNEITKIENTKKRKELFIQIVLPLILEENNNIRADRKKLFNIINKNNNTELEKKWVEKKIQTIRCSFKRFICVKNKNR